MTETKPQTTPTSTAEAQFKTASAPPASDFQRLLAQSEPFSAFGNISMFADAQRMARALCSSTIVPENYRGDPNLGNCIIALEIANRIGASVLAVMQNLYIVHGRPAWSAQFLISCVNSSRRFSPIRYELSEPGLEETVSYSYTVWVNREKQRKEGTMKIVNMDCRAWALDKTGEKLYSPKVSIRMAVEEGWFAKDGSKWKTMPELMLHYRAATLFARLYAPELTMGIQTDDEVADIAPIVTEPAQIKAAEDRRPEVTGFQQAMAPTETPKPRKKPQDAPVTKPAVPEPPPLETPPEPLKAEESQGKPEAVPAPEPTAPSDEEALAAAGLAPETSPAEGMTFVPNATESDALQSVRLLMSKSGVTEPGVISWALENKLAKAGQNLSNLAETKLLAMSRNWPTILAKIRGGKVA